MEKKARKLRKPVFLVMWWGIKAASRLPLWFFFLISRVAYFVVFHVLKYRRQVVRTNLQGSFPDLTPAQIGELERKFYRHFADVFMEIFKVHGTNLKDSQNKLVCVNPELLQGYYDQGRSVIYAAGHYGNWEYAPFLASSVPFDMTAVYATQSNPYSDELVRRSRMRFGCDVTESKQAFRYALTKQKEGRQTLMYMVADQSPTGDQVCWTQFLNRETAFFRGVEKIARKTNHVVVFGKMKKVKRGHYTVEFIPISDDVANEPEDRVITEYARLLEQAIIETPELWLWSHKRWKRSRTGQ